MSYERLYVSIPPEEKEAWEEDKERIGISFSEYVRRRVRSGRRKWQEDEGIGDLETGVDSSENVARAINSDDFSDLILRNLSTTEPVSQEELTELLFQELLDEVGYHLDELSDEGKVKYRASMGGWVKIDE